MKDAADHSEDVRMRAELLHQGDLEEEQQWIDEVNGGTGKF